MILIFIINQIISFLYFIDNLENFKSRGKIFVCGSAFLGIDMSKKEFKKLINLRQFSSKHPLEEEKGLPSNSSSGHQWPRLRTPNPIKGENIDDNVEVKEEEIDSESMVRRIDPRLSGWTPLL
jgi:hypothetical protein